MAEHFVCKCGHGADEHQTTVSGRVLMDGQRWCYGGNRPWRCECDGWTPALVLTRITDARKIRHTRSLMEGVNLLAEQKRPFRWL